MNCQPHWIRLVDIWLFNNQTCLLCDEALKGVLPICRACKPELPWLGDCCLRCALPLPAARLTCGDCLKQSPAFEQVHAAWAYGFPVDSLIVGFKHNSKWPYGRLLAELLGQCLLDSFNCGQERPDFLLPVPLSVQRLRQRGYNQAAMLSHWLSARLNIPCREHWLLRTQDTPTQQALDAKARKRNLLQAFGLSPGAQVQGLHLTLIDDVLTTGATAESLARLLLKAGARRVDVYCLARTPKPDGAP
ncbi:ComF family protein [Pseudomonas paraversuta]|uniref:ComF family protein n=1 Tax=Pseudomonas paraversuta TaxID=2750624 RepID=UPI001932F85D|nr:ComF family protein [Pseudomonas paraversuta]